MIAFSLVLFIGFRKYIPRPIGIGLAIAKRAAQDGANIILAAKTAEPHPKLPGTIYTAADEIIECGGQALPVICDIRDEKNVREAVNKGAEEFGANIAATGATNEKFVTIGGEKNEYDERDDLEPTLGTIVYDTGLITLERVAGHYILII